MEKKKEVVAIVVRALKYKKLRISQPAKVKVELPEELGAVVGDKALQYIGECSNTVKEICRVDVKKWEDMPDDVLDRLFGRIQARFELEGGHIQKAMKDQCSNLFRRWRERLKRDHFKGKRTLKEAERACPPEISLDQWKWLVYNFWSTPEEVKRSETNRQNALSKKIFSACGVKSTARIIHEMDLEGIKEAENQCHSNPDSEASSSTTAAQPEEPIYIRLWKKTNKHKDGKFDDEAEEKLLAFQRLHEQQILEHGIDNLSIDEAFLKVLGHHSGYARGLGQGHPVVPKGGKKTAEMQAELERVREREKQMQSEIESMQEDARRKEKEALEREFKREEENRVRDAKLAHMQAMIDKLMIRCGP